MIIYKKAVNMRFCKKCCYEVKLNIKLFVRFADQMRLYFSSALCIKSKHLLVQESQTFFVQPGFIDFYIFYML